METIQANNAAKFAFFYLLSLVALVFTALAAGMIIFQIINKNIIDIINDYSGRFSQEALKFAISSLVIAAPIFFITMRQIYKNLFSGVLAKNSGIRRWLTYFILLVSSIVMIGWLIGTLNNFLDGDLTMHFLLKSLTALSISALIFSFFLYDIKREEVANKKDKIIKIYFYGSLALVIIVFTASLFLLESPRQTRDRKIDNLIVNDFEQIDNAVNNYFSQNNKLPESLEGLAEEIIFISDEDIHGPVSKEIYEYKRLEDKKYELCAVFRTSNKDSDNQRDFYSKEQWPHEAGKDCIKKTLMNKEDMEPFPIRMID